MKLYRVKCFSAVAGAAKGAKAIDEAWFTDRATATAFMERRNSEYRDNVPHGEVCYAKPPTAYKVPEGLLNWLGVDASALD